MKLPLSHGERGVRDADGEPVSLSVRDVARRFCVCVNACDGVDTECLESFQPGIVFRLFRIDQHAKTIVQQPMHEQVRDFARDIVGHIVKHYRNLGTNISPETEALITQAAESFADSRFPEDGA